MELYARVRRAVRVEGRSQRAVAREFGLARKTVRKMLEYSEPPGMETKAMMHREYSYCAPGMQEAVRATTDADFYVENSESVELWSPGSPVFPVVGDVVSTDEYRSASSLSDVLNQTKP